MQQSTPFQGKQPPITEATVDYSKMSNHQRIKDREIQRALDADADIPFLPSKSRARRMHTTQKRLIDQYKAKHEGEQLNAPTNA